MTIFGKKKQTVAIGNIPEQPSANPNDVEIMATKISELSSCARRELRGCIEEVAKFQLVQPFLSIFGWDLTKPSHGKFEFVTTPGCKADISLLYNSAVSIIIEVKRPGTNLFSADCIEQISKYFETSKASIAILTDGIKYHFYSFAESTPNINTTPFACISIHDIDLSLKDAFLIDFCRDNFDVRHLVDYSNSDYIRAQLYRLLGPDTSPRASKIIHDVFTYKFQSQTPQRVEQLINFTKYHSRWKIRHNK